jgi:hypothetical protein
LLIFQVNNVISNIKPYTIAFEYVIKFFVGKIIKNKTAN